MCNNGTLIFFAISIFIVVSFTYFTRFQYFGMRKVRTIKELHDELIRENPGIIDFQFFSEILKKLGEAYRINPGKIRLDDSLIKFYKVDSWALDWGTEELVSWLEDLKIKWPEENRPQTVKEFVLFLVENK